MNAIIFGACGSIGSYILNKFQIENINSIGTTTDLNKVQKNIICVDTNNLNNLLNIENIDIIVWAQGYNFNDNINNFDENNFDKMISANVKFILLTLNFLIKNNKLNNIFQPPRA